MSHYKNIEFKVKSAKFKVCDFIRICVDKLRIQ